MRERDNAWNIITQFRVMYIYKHLTWFEKFDYVCVHARVNEQIKRMKK